MIRVSVIIPTRDRPGPLAACLATLALDFPEDAETIVVADGCATDLRSVVAPFATSLRLRLLEIPHAGQAAARNRGIAIARGQILAFTDDDCRVAPGWLAALAGGVILAPPRAVGGSTHNGLPDNPYADAAQLVLNLLSRHDRAITGRERLLPSNNFAFPADTLRALGGFDESYRTAEDRELCRRWAGAGFELGRVPSAWVAHDTQLGLWSFVRKFSSYGQGAAQFHRSSTGPSLSESIGFHLRLPKLVLPELRKRTWARAAAVALLLGLWEGVNAWGFAAQMLSGVSANRRRALRPPALAPVATSSHPMQPGEAAASETLRRTVAS